MPPLFHVHMHSYEPLAGDIPIWTLLEYREESLVHKNQLTSAGERVTEVLTLLADKNRLIILDLLKSEARYVEQLCESLHQTQPAVSHHLGLFRDSGLLVDRRDGKRVYYSISEECIRSLRNLSSYFDALGARTKEQKQEAVVLPLCEGNTLTEEGKRLHRTLKSLREPKRLLLMDFLYREGEKNVDEMRRFMQISQPAVSGHLRILLDNGFLKNRRDGKFTYYSLSNEGKNLFHLAAGQIKSMILVS